MLGNHIYIFEIEPNIFKVGQSKNYGHRFFELSQWYERKLVFIKAWKLPEETAAIEKLVHKKLKEFRYQKYGGNEVFECSKNRVISAVKAAIKERGAAKIVGCKAITIRRRKEMWAQGKKLLLEVGKKGSRK